MRVAVPLLPLLLVLAGCSRSGTTPPEAAADDSGPVIRVTASYPGANPQVTYETVATPLCLAIDGVEGQVRLESECRDDGTCEITVRFEPKTDINVAQVVVQNRVALAQAGLPMVVQREGITTRKGDFDRFPRFWVAVTSPDGTHDAPFLQNYVDLKVKDELARVAGVADVKAVGHLETAIRVWPDADKLAARKLTVKDIVTAVGQQNLRVAAKQPGDPPAKGFASLTFAMPGHFIDAAQYGKIILRATAEGEITRLEDVSRVELAANTDGFARVNGKPAALVAVSTQSREIAADDLRKVLADLGKVAPKGAEVQLVADVAADSLAVVELRLPDGGSIARTQEVMDRAVKLLRNLPGKPESFAFAEREQNGATMLVKAPAKDGPTLADLRKLLGELRDVRVRVSDLSSGRPFPVRIAILDKGGHGHEKLRSAGDAVVARLAKDGIAIDPALTPPPASSRLLIEFDQKKLAEFGLSVKGATSSLDAILGDSLIGDPSQDVRAFEVIRNDKFREAGALKTVMLKTPEGKLVPLPSVAKFREVRSEHAILCVNLHPAVVVTADVPPGKTAAETTASCIAAAKAVVPKEFEVFDPVANKPR